MSKDAPEYPYTYQKLDVATAIERGYAGYYNKGGREERSCLI